MKMLIVILALSVSAMGQLWSGILDPVRATDWTGAGVTGGIPTNRTQCGATITAGSGAAKTNEVNTALSTCSSGSPNTFVLLGPGNFTFNSVINLRSNVTLRGSGADQTFLTWTSTGASACQGQDSVICAPASDQSYYAPGPPSHNNINWTAGYAQGTTVITLASVPGLSVGMYILVDGCDTGLSGSACTGTFGVNSDDIVNCSKITVCTTEDGGGASANQRGDRAQREMFKVTNISGTDVTLDHGLRFPNWAALAALGTGTVQAWWGNSGSTPTRVGLENLSLDGTGGNPGAANITFMWATESWIKGVRSLFAPAPRANVLLFQCSHIEVRDSYFYGSSSEAGGPTHYGLETFPAYDVKVENNIFQRRTSPIVMDGCVGCVVGYNYAVNDQYVTAAFLQGSWYSHEGGNGYNLWEGNIGPQFKADVVHGTSNMNTTFRGVNYGWEPGKTSETGAVKMYAFQRFYNHIGNVEGKQSYFTSYASAFGSCSATAVWGFGCGGPVDDAYTGTSAMRWGNYSACVGTNCQTVRFDTGEIATGLAKYPGLSSPSSTLPPSFYLSSKPAFLSTLPWPGIGPDITTGSINATNGSPTPLVWVAQPLGNHANPNAAQVCYETIMGGPADGSGGALTFNADNCYVIVANSPSVNFQGQLSIKGRVAIQ